MFISLLRGINVSGQKKVRMEDLRALYEKLGLKNIVIYIQSGNVIFQTGDLPEPDLVEFLEDAIEKKFGFHVPVLIRSFQELSLIQQSNPFLDDYYVWRLTTK